MKRLIAAAAGAGLALSGGFVASPANASPVITGGLVNVTIVDVIDDVTVTIQDINVAAAIGVAANVCDVNVNVIARQLRNGDTTCTSEVTGNSATIS